MPSSLEDTPGAERHEEIQNEQTRVWASSAEALLARIGVGSGWFCADLGCGARGILPELSHRVGPRGRVIGLEWHPVTAMAAQRMVTEERLANVAIVTGDLGSPPLRRASFDLVHLRFVLHVPDLERCVAETAMLARPRGWVAVEEPDLSTWRYLPECGSWPRLLALLATAIARQGEPSVGCRALAVMEKAGLLELQERAVVLVIRDRHPYLRLPLCWADTQRRLILREGLAEQAELDDLIAGLERHICKPGVMMLTFATRQVWGRAPDRVAKLQAMV